MLFEMSYALFTHPHIFTIHSHPLTYFNPSYFIIPLYNPLYHCMLSSLYLNPLLFKFI